jgi:hypothetical protein
MKRFLIVTTLVILILPAIVVVALFTWVLIAGVPASASGTLNSGRAIVVNSNSVYLSLGLDGDTATINTAGREIVVKPTELLVDGVHVGDVDTAAARVEIIVKRGSVDFIADGNPVKTSNAK